MATSCIPPFTPDPATIHYLGEEGLDIRRERCGEGFRYRRDGTIVDDPEVVERISGLVIPPAWEEVRIASDPLGHLQAVGLDAKGRKQYIYHPEWRTLQQLSKFSRMVGFGEVLPELRDRVERDMRQRGLTRQRILATVVWLLDRTFIRVGSREYMRDNGSYGLTTLREKHVEVSGDRVEFQFKGKSGVAQRVSVTDRRVARTVRQCIDLPGYELFQYLDDEGERRVIAAQDVNGYLKEIAGEDFTAKDFRTWGGSVFAGHHLFELGPCENARAIKKNVTEAVRRTARLLGNTATVCRNYYIHPSVSHAYEQGLLVPHFEQAYGAYDAGRHRLRAPEYATWTLLQEHPWPASAAAAEEPEGRVESKRNGKAGRRQEAA